MKTIAKTTSAIMLMDPYQRQELDETPHLVTWNHFFEARTGKGQIKILASNIPDSATDEDLQAFLKDSGTEELAIASFVSQFEEPKKAAPKAPRKKAESE